MSRKFSVIHDLKLDALEELLEELNGEPLLVAYEFQSDFERVRERFGTVDPKTGQKALPCLGKGTTAAQETQWITAWNRGELPLLCAHPASAGHGLNLQGSSAANVCWFGITWDFELYDQFIRRIRRDGTEAVQIFNHMLVVKDTIDSLKLAALGDKDLTQSGLIRALNYEILRDAETQGTGVSGPTDGDSTMKLSRPGAAPAQAAQEPETQHSDKPAPKGWGKPAGGDAGQAQDTGTQREAIQERINPEANRSAFSKGVQETARQISTGEERVEPQGQQEPEAPKATRRRRAPEPEERAQVDGYADAASILGAGMSVYSRMKAVELAATFRDNFESTTDMFSLADEILAYVGKPA